jgi:PAS domain S-box-containing protein
MRPDRLQFALGVAVLALGAVVLAGWHAHVVWLVQPLRGETPMAYNTALCFALNGAGLLSLSRGRWWGVLPAAALLLASLVLVEYALGLDHLGTLLFTPYFTSGTPFPGRMAPNTALGHVLSGIAILVLGVFQGSRAGMASAIAGAFVTSIGVVCGAGYAAGIEAAYRWGPMTSMAPNTAAGLVLLGLGVASAATPRARHRSLPAIGAALTVATVAVALAQAIAADRVARVAQAESLPAVTLAVGLALAALVGLAVHFGQAARGRAEALMRANIELRAATEELTRQRQFLRQVIDQNPSLIFVKDREGRFTLVNRGMADAYGADVEDHVGKTDADFNPDPEQVRASRRDDLEVMNSGREKVLGEEVMTDARGVRRWLHTVKRPLLGPDGKANGVLGVAVDVSDRKRAEERLAESQRFLEKVVGAAPGIVAVYDLEERRNVYASGKITSTLGYTPEQVAALGASVVERLVHPDDRPRVLQSHAADANLKDGEIRERTFRVRNAAGSWRWLLSRYTPFERKGGRVKQILSIAMDVTEQRHTEEMLQSSQKLEAVGRLAGGIAHDFNNVLGVITGYGELARRQLPPDHAVQPRLEQILQAAERACGLTRQLLALSRRQVVEPHVLDLNAVVSDLDKMLRRVLGEDVDLVVHADPDLGSVQADPAQLEQILMNLVVNARDAMPKGGHLRIETANADFDEEYAASHPPATPGRFVMLAVSDTGVGMDAETRERIFEPFFTTKPAGEGTGLGLATVYGIVKQNGGYIWVYSEPGRGTTFKVYLPRLEARAEAKPAAPATAPVPRGSETLLLVEDTDGLREMICEILQERGYTVLVASNGEEALALAREAQGPIDLLLTDVVMPKLGGADLANQLALARPGIRVLYMSGYTNGVISKHGVVGERVRLLEKPFTPERVARAVREALDRPQPS